MLMAFTDLLGKAWNGIKGLFGVGTKEVVEEPTQPTQTNPQPKTLNEVAQDINRNDVQNVSLNANPLDQFNKQQEAEAQANNIINTQTPDPVSVGFVNPNEAEVTGNVSEAVKERDDEVNKTWWEKLFDGVSEGFNSAVKFTSDAIKGLNANADYNAEKGDMAMYYDKDSGDIYYLDINTSRGLADWDTGAYDGAQTLFDKAYQEFNYNVSNAQTQEDKISAWQDFYEKSKNLFRLRADDYYTDGLLTGENGKLIGRRKDLYSDEQLETLASNKGVDKAGAYIPSFQEFVDYVANLQDNEQLRANINTRYGITESEDTIDLSASTKKKWSDAFYNSAMNGVMDVAKQYLSENEASEAILSSASVVNSQSDRIQNIVNEVYKKEQIVLATPEGSRTEGDNAILNAANMLRQMESLYAGNINEFIKQNIKYGRNSKGELSENIDTFEDGKTLNQLLTDNLKEIAGGNFTSRDSAIDVFQEVANKALYEYNKDSKGAWAWLQRGGDIAGNMLGELGQQSVYGLMGARNLIANVATGDFKAIDDWVQGRSPLSTTANYSDNDITIGRLLQTDMGNNSRTIYKYWLNGLEYVPEGIGNIVPDIALIAATGGGGAGVSAVRWGARVNDAIKAGKATGMLNKLMKASEFSKVAKSTLTGIERVTELAKAATEMNPELRIGAQLLDKAITNGIVDQAIDAQWSAFDTEPYSNTSMFLSLAGTGLGEFLPVIIQSGVIQKMFGQTSIFDIAKYMKENADGIANIAKATNTTPSNITFQDLRNYLNTFDEISDAAKQVYDTLPQAGKDAANKWTKETLYNYLNQFYKLDSQSQVAKDMRRIVANGSTNAADLAKYIGKIPGNVEFGPFVSKIQLKNGTKSTVYGTYDTSLDTLQGGFASRIGGGFTNADIDAISKIDKYSDIVKDKNKYFFEGGDGKYYLKQDGLEHFGLSAENQSLESLGLELAEVEDTKNLFKERMKEIRNTDKAITDETVDAIAESGGYQEIVEKVKEIVC